MKRFVLQNALYLLTALGIGVGLYVLANWSAMPVLQRMVGLFFIGVTLHVWEEFRFPGGFAELITARLNFALADLGLRDHPRRAEQSDAAVGMVLVAALYGRP
jgi:uncharacterized membrane protein